MCRSNTSDVLKAMKRNDKGLFIIANRTSKRRLLRSCVERNERIKRKKENFCSAYTHIDTLKKFLFLSLFFSHINVDNPNKH